MKIKHGKILFYILSWSWGFPMTAIGAIVSVVMIIMGKKAKKWGNSVYFEIGNKWGGINLGMFSFVSEDSGLSTKNHEYGHAIQNCIFGFLMPFLIGIPSAIRYWYRNIKYTRTGIVPSTRYDSIWFERNATYFGNKAYEYIKINNDSEKQNG